MEESKLANLPEYDFSGPSGDDSSSNLDESLLAGTEEEEENQEAQVNANGHSVYLIPICCGMQSTGYVAKNRTGFAEIKSKSGVKNFTLQEYHEQLNKLSGNLDWTKYSHNRFVGVANKNNNGKTYNEWMACWDAVHFIGAQLSKDGCDVYYPYDATSRAKATSDPTTFFGSHADWTIEDVMADVVDKDPDYVIFLGFNENAFGLATGDPERTTKTIISYDTSSQFAGKKYSKKLLSAWNSDTELSKTLPAKRVKAGSYTAAHASKIGEQKSQTWLTSAQINGVKGNVVSILFGSYNSNVADKKAKYSYSKPKTLYAAVANIIEKSM